MGFETFESADGRSVVAADTAEDIGEIKAFIVDPTARRINAVQVAGRGKRASIVPWASIQSFGDDAVVITKADAIERVEGDHDTQVVKGNITLRGTRILTTTGFEVGTVKDVVFDTDSGELTEATTPDGRRIDASSFTAIGSYAFILETEHVEIS